MHSGLRGASVPWRLSITVSLLEIQNAVVQGGLVGASGPWISIPSFLEIQNTIGPGRLSYTTERINAHQS
jgi:hypothetical protein